MPLMEVKSVAVVTGASQGLGRATALRLARDFSAVVLVARDKENLETTASQITSQGAKPMICAIDLRLPQSAERLSRALSIVSAESMPCSTLPAPCHKLICSR